MKYDDILGAPIANVSRRAFLTGIAAGSLILSAGLSARAAEEKYAGDGMANGLREDPKIFIAIAEDGSVTVLCHRSEMGQGVRTSWPLVVADELEACGRRIERPGRGGVVVAKWVGEPIDDRSRRDGRRSDRHGC